MFSESALRSLEAQQQLETELLAVTRPLPRGKDSRSSRPISILLADELSEQLAVQRKRLESVQSRIAASEALSKNSGWLAPRRISPRVPRPEKSEAARADQAGANGAGRRRHPTSRR